MSSLLNDSTFWSIGVSGFLIAVIGLTIRYVYKIKCSECDCCCGCIKCTRNVDVEANADAIPPQQNDSPTPTLLDGGRSSHKSPSGGSRAPDIFSRV